MSERPGFAELPESDPEVESALALVGRPSARQEFRVDLRRAFLSAAEASVRVSLAPDLHGEGRHGDGSSFSPLEATAGRRRVLLRFGGLVAAALILAVGFIFLQSPAPRWSVLDLAAGSVVKADGAIVSSENPATLVRVLQHAREIEVEKGDLVLQVGDLSLFGIGAGTRVSFAGFDRNSPGNPFEVDAKSGRLRVRTGPGFRGRTMKVRGDVIDATVTGTAIAIDYEDQGTCVCCLHGDVQVTSKALGPSPKAVAPDHMCFVYRDPGEPSEPRKPRWGDPPDRHAAPLKALELRALEIWPPASSR